MSHDRAIPISIAIPNPPETEAKYSIAIENCDLLSDAASNSTDGSHMLFSLYNQKAMETDRNLVDNWTKDADSVMLLGGLISATVSTFLSQTYVGSSRGDISTSPGSLLTNFFWFISLGLGLSSVVVANLLQGWVRGYSAMTQPQRRSDDCARIRAYVLHEKPLDSFQLTANSMRLLLDLSIFSFLFGLFVLTLSYMDLLSTLAVLMAALPLLFLYVRSTLNSLRHSYTVFSTPMSNVLAVRGRRLKQFVSLSWALVNRRQVHDPEHVIGHNWLWLNQAAHLTEKLVKSDSLSLDREIVETILKSLYQGHELERFLASIPGFYRSAHVQEPAEIFQPFSSHILSNGIVSFIDHTLSSQTLSDEAKRNRIKLSLEVMDVDPYLLQRTLFYALTRATQPIIFQCVDFVLVADRSANSKDQTTQLLAKCIIAVAISHLKDHQPDPRLSRVFERWLNSATFANNYRGGRASMKMINLARLVRVLNSAGQSNWDEMFGKALLAVAKFEEVESAADEYKMEFCILWNQLLDAASANGESKSNASHILPHVENVYTTLHGGTDPNKSSTHDSIPARYTLCTISTHYLAPRATSPSSLKLAQGGGEAHTLRRRFSLPSHVGLPAA